MHDENLNESYMQVLEKTLIAAGKRYYHEIFIPNKDNMGICENIKKNGDLLQRILS